MIISFLIIWFVVSLPIALVIGAFIKAGSGDHDYD